MSTNVDNYTFHVHENKNDSTRRGLITIKNVKTGKAIEYAILQSGKKGYAITETNGRMPIGVLTSNYEPTSENHGLEFLVDKNLDTYFEAATKEEFFIDWEGPYPIPITHVQFGRVEGDCCMSGMGLRSTTDGINWEHLVGLGYGGSWKELINATSSGNSRLYRLVVGGNYGGPTTRVSEYGLKIDYKQLDEKFY